MQARTGLGVGVGVVLTVLVLAIPSASAAGVPAVSSAASSSTTLWAYGALKTVSLSGKGVDSTSPYAYTINAYYGWQVILSQTNVTANVTEIEINRTVGLVFYASYCRPDCSSPFANENVTILYHESGAGFVNLTNTAQVDENGRSVAAVGVINESGEDHSSYTRATTATLTSSAGPKTYNWDAATQTNGTAVLTFTPALGLFPTALTNGTSWNASAAFAAAGGWGVTASYVANPIVGPPVSLSGRSSGAISRNGTLALFGSDLGNVTLADGSVVQALAISVLGPFALREGIFILPTDAEALPSASSGTGPTPVTIPQSYGNLSLVANAADIRPTGAGHFGLSASYAQIAGASSAPAASSVALANEPLASAPAADGPGTVGVQAQPESVAQAQQGANCLAQGTCPLGSPGSTGARGALLIGLAVVVVGVLVAALVVDRRRREPAPPRPNARLYPAPGSAGGLAATPAERRPAPGAEVDDPLDNLW